MPTLSYFLPVIEEVVLLPPEPGYVEYLRAKLAPPARNCKLVEETR